MKIIFIILMFLVPVFLKAQVKNYANWVSKNEMFVKKYYVLQYTHKKWVRIDSIAPVNSPDSSKYSLALPALYYYYMIVAVTPNQSYYTTYKYNK